MPGGAADDCSVHAAVGVDKQAPRAARLRKKHGGPAMQAASEAVAATAAARGMMSLTSNPLGASL